MSLELILLIYTTIIFIIYNTYILIKYGMLESISASYYKINYKILFSFFIWSISFPVMIIGGTWLAFLGGSFLTFVGASPLFLNGMERKIHIVSANSGIALICFSMGFDYNLWWISITVGIISVIGYIFKPKYWVWIIEMVAFLCIISGLILIRIF